jgi:hypothetical protein
MYAVGGGVVALVAAGLIVKAVRDRRSGSNS